jgi:hypothetical protein
LKEAPIAYLRGVLGTVGDSQEMETLFDRYQIHYQNRPNEFEAFIGAKSEPNYAA